MFLPFYIAWGIFEHFYMKCKSCCCAHGVSIKWAWGGNSQLGSHTNRAVNSLAAVYWGVVGGRVAKMSARHRMSSTNKLIIKTCQNESTST